MCPSFLLPFLGFIPCLGKPSTSSYRTANFASMFPPKLLLVFGFEYIYVFRGRCEVGTLFCSCVGTSFTPQRPQDLAHPVSLHLWPCSHLLAHSPHSLGKSYSPFLTAQEPPLLLSPTSPWASLAPCLPAAAAAKSPSVSACNMVPWSQAA